LFYSVINILDYLSLQSKLNVYKRNWNR
jgi:hypothetical protein